jgi:hypothetical protein
MKRSRFRFDLAIIFILIAVIAASLNLFLEIVRSDDKPFTYPPLPPMSQWHW